MEEAPDLYEYVLPNVAEEEDLWADGYSCTMMVITNDVECAGKKLHAVMMSEPENLKKFIRECRLVKGLRHPHIVQFLGICFRPSSCVPAVLVTELLPYNLHHVLEVHTSIPFSVKLSILHDIARGLLYLHDQSPPIVHRDLSALNIRLNSALTAKITNFGTAKSIYDHLKDGNRGLTACPGTSAYMPPEACTYDIIPEYSSKLDIFSFGVILLFAIINEYPEEILPATYIDENQVLRPRDELERRCQHMDKAEQVHL